MSGTLCFYSLLLGVFVFPGPRPLIFLPVLALNLYLPAPAPALSLFLPPLALNLCLPFLRFTVQVCYNYSVYLYKLSVYLFVLIF